MNKFLCLLLSLLLLSSCENAEITVCHSRGELNVLSTVVWAQTEIKVCWQADTYYARHAEMRANVQEAIELSWNAALAPEEVPEDLRVHFVGWEKCQRYDGSDFPIRIHDEGNYVSGLGTKIQRMSLNFDILQGFPLWRVRRVAIHEFGHALALAHEHNREDFGYLCSWESQGTDGDTYLGWWDKESIMNYCSDPNLNKDNLTEGDIYWIRRVYYPEYFPYTCTVL